VASMPARRTSYLSPAACAFIASGIEILSFAYYRLQRSTMIHRADSDIFPLYTSLYVALFVGVLAVAAQARALWHVGGIRRIVAPFSSRAGRWAVATYVVVGVLVPILMAMRLLELFPGLLSLGMDTVAQWLIRLPRYAQTLAFAFLGWASLGRTRPWQRWASTGLLVIGALGILSIVSWLLGWPRGPRPMWLSAVHTLMHAATWAAIGAWLRRAEGLNEWH
jgi:hypothetical protein